jgi:two-component system OmpR family response regulator
LPGGVAQVEIRVLLVEAEAPLRRSLENFLERAGYIFKSCSSGREALLVADAFDPDAVIAEYHLPDANGAELLGKLTRIKPDLRTTLISEFDFQAIADALVRVNVGSFLKKPFDLAELEIALSSGSRRRKVNAESQKSGCEVCLPTFLNKELLEA